MQPPAHLRTCAPELLVEVVYHSNSTRRDSDVNRFIPGLVTCYFPLHNNGATGFDADVQRAIDAALSEAKGQVQNLQASNDSRIINDEFDYGWTVSFSIKNVGKAGIIMVSPWISCSEGEWSLFQKVSFAAGETKSFTYFFHEPTINASNGQYGVKVNPH